MISLLSLILDRPLFRTADVERLLARQVLSSKQDVRLERAASVPKEFVSLQGFTPNITAKREMLIVLRLYLLENRRRRQASIRCRLRGLVTVSFANSLCPT